MKVEIGKSIITKYDDESILEFVQFQNVIAVRKRKI